MNILEVRLILSQIIIRSNRITSWLILSLVNQFNDHLSLGYRYGKLPATLLLEHLLVVHSSDEDDPETHSDMSE